MILKPGESDPDYATDGTGRYLLAVDHLLRGMTPAELAEAWRYVRTPLGAYRPLPYARKFHRSRKRFRWALGGNRSSKSQALAVETVWRATGRHPFRLARVPATVWYATTTWEKVGELYREKLKVLLGGVPGVSVVWHNKAREVPAIVRVPVRGGTSLIVCKAFEQGREAFQMGAVDAVHFDEQFGQPIFTEATTRIGAGQAADFAAALTPIIPQQWAELRTTVEQPGGDDVFYFPLDDQREDWGGFIPGPLIDATIANWPPETRETRRYGRWGSYAGAAFQTFSRATHVVEADRERRLFFRGEKVPHACETIGSIDWGGNNPFVFLWMCRIPWLDDDWYVYDEYYWSFAEKGPRRLEEHAREINERTAWWEARRERVWADHDPTDANEFWHMGVPSAPTEKSNKLAGIETLQGLFAPRPHLSGPDWPAGRPRLHVAARCKNTIREVSGSRWREGSEDRDAPRELVKKDDHTVDALRYGIESERPYDSAGGVPRGVDLGGKFRRTF